MTRCRVSGQVPQSLLRLRLSPAAAVACSPPAHARCRLACLGSEGQAAASAPSPARSLEHLQLDPHHVHRPLPPGFGGHRASTIAAPAPGSRCRREPGVCRRSHLAGQDSGWSGQRFSHGMLFRISQLKMLLERGPRKPTAFFWFPLITALVFRCAGARVRGVRCSREPSDCCGWDKVQVAAALGSPGVSAGSPACGDTASLPCVTAVVCRW